MSEKYEICKIFIAGFSPLMKEENISHIFCDCGKIKSISIKRNTGKPPFCFVVFSTQEEVHLAISKYNNFPIDNRKLTVKQANSKVNSTAKKIVYPFL
jgi:RNA recognition motif-containing protein